MKKEFREDSPAPSGDVKETGRTPEIEKREKSTLSRWAENLLQMGLGESMLRVGTSVLSLVVINGYCCDGRSCPGGCLCRL